MLRIAVFAVFAVSSSLPAQVPQNAVMVLESWVPFATNIHYLVDAWGRGGAAIPGQTTFSVLSHTSIAIDPVDPASYFAHSDIPGAIGTFRMQVGPGAGILGIEAEVSGPWFATAARRIEVGPDHVFVLRNGNVEWCGRLPFTQAPAVLFAANDAVDLACKGRLLWVATNQPNQATPLIERDLVTGAQRVVGAYAGATAIAASPLANELSLGFEDGSIATIDAASGQVLAVIATGLGPITAVGYTSFGTRVWADASQVRSEVVTAAPIHVARTAIVDLSVSVQPTASVAVFGAGCAVGATARWGATSLPLLGNANFELTVWSVPAGRLAMFAIGTSRSVSSVLAARLPFDMGPFGAPGCKVLVDPQVLLLHVVDQFQMATQVVPIPNSPALVDTEIGAQWFIQEPIGWFGLVPTSAVAFVLR
ncbi:MAG: hypothetical protein FJ265_21955 [Planctomycetes bacterium]|nr:hypothetical protein [Planctomycetota bacterium]